jgi:FKBP-type peptidyl-prolyl cis-trans isomerase 2
LEQAPSTGTPRVQRYFETTDQTRITRAKAIVGNKVFVDFTHGTKGQDINDCSKEGNVIIQK